MEGVANAHAENLSRGRQLLGGHRVDDVAEAARFYGALFDWTFIEAASKPRYSSPSTTASAETDWTRDAQIRDPQGAEFTVRHYRPPD